MLFVLLCVVSFIFNICFIFLYTLSMRSYTTIISYKLMDYTCIHKQIAALIYYYQKPLKNSTGRWHLVETIWEVTSFLFIFLLIRWIVVCLFVYLLVRLFMYVLLLWFDCLFACLLGLLVFLVVYVFVFAWNSNNSLLIDTFVCLLFIWIFPTFFYFFSLFFI